MGSDGVRWGQRPKGTEWRYSTREIKILPVVMAVQLCSKVVAVKNDDDDDDEDDDEQKDGVEKENG